uniref:Gustatory receptor n=1 Tax=Tetranychus urticae TaxID=32264 RepID=A0A158P5D9_TETUR
MSVNLINNFKFQHRWLIMADTIASFYRNRKNCFLKSVQKIFSFFMISQLLNMKIISSNLTNSQLNTTRLIMPNTVTCYYRYRKNLLLKYLRNIFSFFIISHSNDADSYVFQLVRRTERLTIIYQVVRHGLNQSKPVTASSIGYRQLNRWDWIIGITCLINWVRVLILICDDSESVAIYLGDPLFRNKDRRPLFIMCFIILPIIVIFRELILGLESKGNLELLHVWNVCLNGFTPIYLNMDNINCKKLRTTIIIVSNFAHYAMLVVPLILSLLFIFPFLTNPWMYKIPKLFFTSFIWSFPSIFSCSVLLNGMIGFSWYLICSLSFHLFRLTNLLNVADLLNKSTGTIYVDREVKLLCLLAIRRLNSFEFAVEKLRYVFLYIVIVFAFSADVYIFLGGIIRIYNDILANLYAILGMIMLSGIGGFAIAFGSFISKLDSLTIKLHQLSCKNKLSLQTASKILELMDRAAGPYNGVKIGDFVTLEKRFFILFIVENISLLMLFTVNIGPLISDGNRGFQV